MGLYNRMRDVAYTHVSLGDPRRYFDNYTEVTYNASCGDLCPLPVSQDVLMVTELKVFFPHNHTEPRANCSWILPGSRNNSNNPHTTTVMFFEPSKLVSLSHNVPCGTSTPSLTLWDEYSSSGGEVQTTYSICRNSRDDGPEAYSRKSSRLGGADTLITLRDYPYRLEANPTLLKYITVDWSRDCFKDSYKTVEVDSEESMTTLGSQWFTSRLRLPNGMHCKWKLSSPASSTDLIRLRVSVLKRTSTTPGSCAQDDYLQMKDGAVQDERFNLCDNATSYFFVTPTASLFVDFYSGGVGGAPEFEMSYSHLDSCPSPELLLVESDLVENVVYGVSDRQWGLNPCRWTLNTNWTNNVIMLTRLDAEQFQQDCTGEDYLQLELGGTSRNISLCGADPHFPLWSFNGRVSISLHHKPRASSRRVGVFYKSVPTVPYCQGHPGILAAESTRENTVHLDSAAHVTNREVSAPDCRWLIHPSPSLSKPDHYVAKVMVADSGAKKDFWETNTTTAHWMISGFRAYSGDAANASASIAPNCYYAKNAVLCEFLSLSHTLLLVYNPSLSTAPVPLDEINLIYREVVRTDTSGQTGSHVLGYWHAHLLLLVVVAVRRLLC
ncbi:hypothetical protein ACOMHN_050261 [Nucella lapillus]